MNHTVLKWLAYGARCLGPLRACVAYLVLLSCAAAQPYSDLVVFGDSLSDVGNTQYTTSTGFFGLLVSDTPGDSYFDGRFSDGPVWTEWLSSGLGFGDLTPERQGGDNFAFGGARTAGTDLLTDIYIDDLATQVDNFVDNRTGDPNALYTMLIGANDLFQIDTSSSETAQTNYVVDATARVRTALQDLYDDGARNFLVLNLPLLGLTPTYSSAPEGAVYWNDLTDTYNLNLGLDVDLFEQNNADATVFRLDTAGLLNNLIANASDFFITNTTDSAAPGLDAGDNGYDENLIVPNPEEYVFWDGVHPTASVHRLLGYAALRTVLPAGDYDLNGVVDNGDYTTWRDAYGSTELLAADGNGDGIVDAADYALWRNNLPAAPGVGAAAPEPAGFCLLLMLAAALWFAQGGFRSPLLRR